MEIVGGFDLLALEAPNYLLIAHATECVGELGCGCINMCGKKHRKIILCLICFLLFGGCGRWVLCPASSKNQHLLISWRSVGDLTSPIPHCARECWRLENHLLQDRSQLVSQLSRLGTLVCCLATENTDEALTCLNFTECSLITYGLNTAISRFCLSFP